MQSVIISKSHGRHDCRVLYVVLIVWYSVCVVLIVNLFFLFYSFLFSVLLICVDVRCSLFVCTSLHAMFVWAMLPESQKYNTIQYNAIQYNRLLAVDILVYILKKSSDGLNMNSVYNKLHRDKLPEWLLRNIYYTSMHPHILYSI